MQISHGVSILLQAVFICTNGSSIFFPTPREKFPQPEAFVVC